jgi:hypothetical protein
MYSLPLFFISKSAGVMTSGQVGILLCGYQTAPRLRLSPSHMAIDEYGRDDRQQRDEGPQGDQTQTNCVAADPFAMSAFYHVAS